MFRGPFRYLPIGAPHYRSEAENLAARRSRRTRRRWNRRRKRRSIITDESTSVTWTRPFRCYVPLRPIYDSRRQNYSYRLVSSIDPDATRSVSTRGSAASVWIFLSPRGDGPLDGRLHSPPEIPRKQIQTASFWSFSVSVSRPFGGCAVIRSFNGRTRLYLRALSRFLERGESRTRTRRIPTRFSLPHRAT